MKILMIGAHQDDNEFRCGGIAKKYVKMGHEVRFLSLTNGAGGHHIMSPAETVTRRAKESRAVARLLGITYDIWELEDGCLQADLSTRLRLISYIRDFCPDVVITHRQGDYHPDHRAAGVLLQDAVYMLAVPHICPETPAMRRPPVMLYYEDRFTAPPFTPHLVVDIDDVIDTKLQIAALNVSQVYEWLPYLDGETVPADERERFAWLKGMEITADTTDEEVLSAPRGYAVRFAKTAARFRGELIAKYGWERGGKIRYAEAFEISEYGRPLDEETRKALFEI